MQDALIVVFKQCLGAQTHTHTLVLRFGNNHLFLTMSDDQVMQENTTVEPQEPAVASKKKSKASAAKKKTSSQGSRGVQRTRAKDTKAVSSSAKAGLLFPVGRMRRYLKQGRFAERVSATAPVYLASVLEYLAAEVFELAGNVARDQGYKRINPRAILLALKNDEELSKVVSDAIVLGGGVLPTVDPILRSGKKKKKNNVVSGGKPRKRTTLVQESSDGNQADAASEKPVEGEANSAPAEAPETQSETA